MSRSTSFCAAAARVAESVESVGTATAAMMEAMIITTSTSIKENPPPESGRRVLESHRMATGPPGVLPGVLADGVAVGPELARRGVVVPAVGAAHRGRGVPRGRGDAGVVV